MMNEEKHICLAELSPEERGPEFDPFQLEELDRMQDMEISANDIDIEDYYDEITGQSFRVITSIRSANYGPNTMRLPIGIMLHHTAGRRAGDLATLTRRGTGVSANDYITKDGTIYELCPWPRRAWHAGSADRGTGYVSDGNTYYWGIEIENLGNGSDPYTKAQINAIIWRCRLIVRRHGIKNRGAMIRHRDFSPSRKSDPSNNFPYAYVKNAVFGGGEPQKPTPPPTSKPQKPERVMFVYHKNALDSTRNSADAAAYALKSVGVRADSYSDGKNANYAAGLALDGRLGQNVLVVQGTMAMLLFKAANKENFTHGGEWFHPDKSDVWDARRNVVQQTRWNISRLCERAGADKGKALMTFDNVYNNLMGKA